MTMSTLHDDTAAVLYDGQCPLCRKSIAIVKRLDWRKRLSYHDARDIEHLPPSDVPLDPAAMMQEMHLLTPDRKRVYKGFRAFRYMSARLPLLWAFWPMLFLPGVPWLGERVYLRVARNRYNLVPCHDGECAVPLRPPADKARTPSG